MKKKQLSKEERRGEEAFAINQKISDNEKTRRRLFLENVGLLEEVLDRQLYKDILGDEEADWVAFLGQVEVYYARSEVMKWLKIKRILQDKFGFDLEKLLDLPSGRLGEISAYALS